MVKIEDGHIVIGGNIKEVFIEAARLADIVTDKMAEITDGMTQEKSIELFLEAMDYVRNDREKGRVMAIEAETGRSGADQEEIEKAFQDTIEKLRDGGSPEIVTTELASRLEKSGMKVRGTGSSIFDLEVAKPKKSKKDKKSKKSKKDKKDKKSKKDEKSKKSKKDKQIDRNDPQNFPYIKPETFKKKRRDDE